MQRASTHTTIEHFIDRQAIPAYLRFFRSYRAGEHKPRNLWPLVILVLLSIQVIWIFAAHKMPSFNEMFVVPIALLVAASGFFLLHLARQTICGAASLAEGILTSEAQIEALRVSMYRLFAGSGAHVSAIAFCAVGLTLVWLLDPADMTEPRKLVGFATMGLAYWVCGYGLWELANAVLWIRSLVSNGPLLLSIVPARTLALRAVSRLASQLSLYFSIQAAICALAMVTVKWVRADLFTEVLAGLVIPSATISLLGFLYPQFLLHNLVEAEKATVVGQLESRIQTLRREIPTLFESKEAADALNRLHNLRDAVQDSNIVDVGTIIRYAISALPIAVSLYQKLFPVIGVGIAM